MFNKYKIDIQILRTLEKMGLTTPTPVQEKAIPMVLEGRDVIALAETGSGKTIAYLAPTLTHVLQSKSKNILVLSPTRELSTQISTVVRDLLVFSPGMPSALLIGGAAMSQQVRSLKKKPQILVATPGRLMDHVRQRTVDLRNITHLILDEADRMFDMGFAPQVNEIVKLLPTERQTLLFSATFSKEVRGLADRILRNPVEIEVRKSERPPITIEQKVIEISSAEKNDKTLDLINAAKGSVVIFTRTKHRTDRLAEYLIEYGVKATRIHGDRSQGQRNKSITDFKTGIANVLVATDLAARGLDVASVTDVINYDIPQTADDYVHRIGRTGRAGQAGQSLTLVTNEDRENWNYIAKKMQLPFIGSPQRPRPKHNSNSNRPQNNHRQRDAGRSQGFDRPRSAGGQQGSDRPRSAGGQQGSDRPRSAGGGRTDRPRSTTAGGSRPQGYNKQRDTNGPQGNYRQHSSDSKPQAGSSPENRSYKPNQQKKNSWSKGSNGFRPGSGKKHAGKSYEGRFSR